MGVRAALGIAAATVLVLVGAILGIARLGDSDEVARLVARDMPRTSDYSMVALPSGPAPEGAYIETSHYADPVRDGQVVLFEYPGFTLHACSLIEGISRPESCAAGDRHVLRTVRQGDVLTTYSVGGKDVPARGALAADVQRWVTSTSAFVKVPGWLTDYSKASLEKEYRG